MDAPTANYKPINDKSFILKYNEEIYILIISSNSLSIKMLLSKKDNNENYSFQEIMTLEQLMTIHNSFKVFDSIDLARNSIEQIISNNKYLISKKDNDNIILTLKITLFENISDACFILKKKEMSQNELISKLCQDIKNMNEEIKELKEEINKIKKNNDNNIINKLINEIKELKEENNNLKKYYEEIKEWKENKTKENEKDSEEYKFKFKEGLNYSLNENRTIATKNSGKNDWNCYIIGDKEIPINKISKFKIKLNEFKMKSGNLWDVLIGIGPNMIENKANFHRNCWSLICGNSDIYDKEKRQISYSKGTLKKGDIVEVIIDRIKGNLSFGVNGVNLGIGCQNIPNDIILFPCIGIYDILESVEIVQ